jgi:hypothetical protein
MASMPSKADPPIPTLDEWAAEVAARRARYGNPVVPRNSGKNRTESKRALLKAIADAGGKW